MLILKICNNREKVKKVKGLFRKKIIYENSEDIKRYSLNIDGRVVTVLEFSEENLNYNDVLALLKIYKGQVLVSKDYYQNPILKEYLFDPREYYQRAVLSSLKNQIRTVNRDWENICIKLENFSSQKEFFEIVKISKNVTFITQKNQFTDKFLNDCYYKFGAVVSVKEEASPEYDVYLNLEEIEDSGKLMIKVKNKNFLLYPDSTYFSGKEEYQKLLPYNIEHNIICAAFCNK